MKNMPVNPTLIPYREDPKGKERFVTPEGDVVAGSIAFGKVFDGVGYISHFATCPASKEARRKGHK